MKFDLLCVFGRGIEKVGGVWQPTQYIERLSEKGGHPGVRAKGITPFDDDPRVVIAGGNVNAMALALLCEEFAANGNPPKTVVFAAGRPAYLAEESEDVTEGHVMHAHILRFCVPPNVETVFQGNNRNTKDDVAETMALAKARGFSRVGIITVGVHVPRCQEFMKHVSPNNGIDVRWFASEHVVLRRYPETYIGFYKLWEAMISPAWCRTAERERKGIEDLRAGRYNFGSQGYAFAPAK